MGKTIHPTGIQIKGDKRFLLATCRHILFDGKCRHKCLNLATISWLWPLKSCNLRDVGVYQNEESIPNNFCWPRPGIYEHKLSFYLATRSYFENYYPKIDWINAPARTIHFAERCASKGANDINLCVSVHTPRGTPTYEVSPRRGLLNGIIIRPVYILSFTLPSPYCLTYCMRSLYLSLFVPSAS